MAEEQSYHDSWIRSQPSFCYTPLDTGIACIRLIEVLPSGDDGPIRCRMTIANLDERPVFIALSYTWDPPNSSQAYVLFDETGMRTGKNLWNFLRRYSIRQGRSGVRLWVDAICIDQNNLSERNHQVSMMRLIYTRAQTVITWLGEAVNDEHLAFRVTEEGSACLESIEVQDAIARLFEKRYWSRVWIIQEYILPPNVLIWCGNLSANADAFDQPWPTRLRTRLNEVASRILNYRNIWHRRVTKRESVEIFGLYNLIRSFETSQTSEEYDKIYAFLGLASASGYSAARIKPDYSKTKAELLMDVIRFENHAGVSSFELVAEFAHLRYILRISNLQLVSLLRNATEDVGCHAYALLCFGSVTAPLHYVAGVKTLLKSTNRLRNSGPAKPSDTGAAINPLRILRRLSRLTQHKPAFEHIDDTLSWNLRVPLVPSVQRDKRLVLESAVLLINNLIEASYHQPRHRGFADPQDDFFESFDQDPWAQLSNLTPAHYHGRETVYTRFEGTDGRQGVLVSESRWCVEATHDMPLEVYSFEGDDTHQRGLLVRRQSHSPGQIIGPGWVRGLAVFDNPDSQSTKAVASESLQGAEWATLSPLALLELQRIHVLNQTQVRIICAHWLRGTSFWQPDYKQELKGLDHFGPVWSWKGSS